MGSVDNVLLSLVDLGDQVAKLTLEVVLVDRKASKAREEPDEDHDYEHALHMTALLSDLSPDVIFWPNFTAASSCSVVAVDWNQHKQCRRPEGRDEDCADDSSNLEPNASPEEPIYDHSAKENVDQVDEATAQEQI